MTGLARGVGTPRLAASADGSAWTNAGAVTFDKFGVVTVDVEPTRTTRYRLEGEDSATAAVLIQVSPRLQLAHPSTADPFSLRGTVRPRLRGALVGIERRKGSGWAAVGEAVVDASGAFVLELDTLVPPGAYRAVLGETTGFTAGVSPVLQVVG